MILVIEFTRHEPRDKVAKVYEKLWSRILKKYPKEKIEVDSRDPYEAMKRNDQDSSKLYIVMVDAGNAPQSIRRVCDDRCIITAESVVWRRLKDNDLANFSKGEDTLGFAAT